MGAIVASLFFMLVFGIIDFGFAFHSWNNAVNSAREGARTAAVDPSVSDITARVRDSAETLDQSNYDQRALQPQWGQLRRMSAAPLGRGRHRQGHRGLRVRHDHAGRVVRSRLGPTLTLHSQSESRFEGQ